MRERVPPLEPRPIRLTIRDLFLWRFQGGLGVRSRIACQKPPIESPDTPEIASPGWGYRLNGGPFVIIFRLRTIMPQPCAGVCLRVIGEGDFVSHTSALCCRDSIVAGRRWIFCPRFYCIRRTR